MKIDQETFIRRGLYCASVVFGLAAGYCLSDMPLRHLVGIVLLLWGYDVYTDANGTKARAMRAVPRTNEGQ